MIPLRERGRETVVLFGDRDRETAWGDGREGWCSVTGLAVGREVFVAAITPQLNCAITNCKDSKHTNPNPTGRKRESGSHFAAIAHFDLTAPCAMPCKPDGYCDP